MTRQALPADTVTVLPNDVTAPSPTSRRSPAASTHSSLEDLHDWHLLGAQEKARSVQVLTRGLNIRTLLEIGSGTGAILERLDDAGFADRYFAVEPSASLFEDMVERGAISRLAATDADNATIAESRLAHGHYDLCVLSHVLEHVENPAGLLSATLDLADYAVVEVPLGGTWLGTFRAQVKAAVTRVPRHNNAAGHAQFFSRSDIHSLVSWCGGEVVRSRAYVPFAQMRHASQTGPRNRRAYARLVWTLARVTGERFWARSYYGHYAVLIRARGAIPPAEKTNWNLAYFGVDTETVHKNGTAHVLEGK